jgi:hypothetical protein
MSNASDNKKRIGRPPVGATFVGVRYPPGQLAALDTWAASQPDQPSRPEAIRRLVDEALREKGAAQRSGFTGWLLDGPKVDDFPIERDRDAGRTVEI